MRVVLLVLALSLCCATAPSAGAAPVRAARSCGHVHAGGARLKVRINRGKVSCHTARRVLRIFMSGGGKQHGSGGSATYWQLGHWRCAGGAGGGGCIRHGHSYNTARDRISATI